MPISKRPSQRDIAVQAKVSQTVVSHVLNGKSAQHGIPKETEQRVRDAMAALGYVPNPSARSLRQGRNSLIGVHTFETLFPTRQNSYYYEFMVGVEERAIQLGQDLLLLTSAHQYEGDQDIYRGGGNRLRMTDGAIILGFNQDDAELSRLAAEGFPFVFIGRRQVAADLMPYVTADYATAMRTVTDLLADHGHRRISYLGLADTEEPRLERRAGVQARAAERGLELAELTLVESGGVGAEWLRQVIADGVSVVVVETSHHLHELAAIAAQEGISIPDQLSMVVLDAPYSSQPDDDQQRPGPDWTHIAVPRREMGGRAVSILLELLNGQCDVDYAEELDCTFHPGTTVINAAS